MFPIGLKLSRPLARFVCELKENPILSVVYALPGLRYVKIADRGGSQIYHTGNNHSLLATVIALSLDPIPGEVHFNLFSH